MRLFSKSWQSKSILLSLAAHFTLWWAASSWVWTRFYVNQLQDIPIILVGPIYFGVFYLQVVGFRILGAAGLFASFALVTLTFLSITKQRVWIALLAHLAVLLYWFLDFTLLAIGD